MIRKELSEENLNITFRVNLGPELLVAIIRNNRFVDALSTMNCQ